MSEVPESLYDLLYVNPFPVAATSITLYQNGASDNGLELTIEHSRVDPSNPRTLATYLSTFLTLDVHNYDEEEDGKMFADRVYTASGKLVTTFADVQLAEKLYVVPPGLLFVWPFVSIGHRVVVDAAYSPTAEKIVLESFSESPRTFHIHNFFSSEEADTLIARVLEITDEANKLQPSHVGHQSGARIISKKRTSENAFDQTSATSLAIQKRSFDLLNLGEWNQDMADGIQLLRYTQKQAYTPHTDWFGLDTSNTWNWDPSINGSNRFATVFLYLSNVTRGGATVFPLADMPLDASVSLQHPSSDTLMSQDEILTLFGNGTWEADMALTCQNKLAMYPIKGRAVLFYSQKPNGEMDERSLHGGCPVLDGTKWAANLWVWNRKRYGLTPLQRGENTAQTDTLKLNIKNTLDYDVDLYWETTFLVMLPAGESTLYDSHDGHVWNFKVAGTQDLVNSHTCDYKQGKHQMVKVMKPVEVKFAGDDNEEEEGDEEEGDEVEGEEDESEEYDEATEEEESFKTDEKDEL